MALDRFELLELRRDDGVQTYHARDLSTRRPVQVHLFADPHERQTLELLAKLAYLPEIEKRRVLDRGIFQGRPYVVTDRLAGFANLKEWLDIKTAPTVDQQFARLFEEALQPTVVPDDTPELSEQGERVVEISIPGWLLALGLGVAAAALVLVVMMAVLAFRPHHL